jgi:hypothetical protein
LRLLSVYAYRPNQFRVVAGKFHLNFIHERRSATYNPRLILVMYYNARAAWDVEVTDEFKAWWSGLTEAEHISVERAVLLLEERDPHLPFPYSSGVTGSGHSAMRELRVQHQGHPYRVLYIFDPRRVALLL